jgi:HSP20 family protein
MTLPVRNRNGRRHDELVGRDPWSELERLHRELEQLVERTVEAPLEGFVPVADVEEAPDAYLVEIELPGVRRDDVDVEVSGRRLSVHGQRTEKERTGILRRRERTVGRFAYEVTLPGQIEEAQVEAHLSDGVLTVRLPKPAGERPRRIDVR